MKNKINTINGNISKNLFLKWISGLLIKNEDIMRRKRQKLDDHNINTQSILKDAMNDIKAFDK